MDRRPQRSHLFASLGSTMSNKAAFSSKNGLPFLKHDSNAGIVAGVFFWPRRLAVQQDCGQREPIMAELLHQRGDAAVQLVPNSLAQTTTRLRR
jgi:hypothetical protein